ncbi:hypothetical protein BJY00DRAFT_296598, partial [Aspergillus carlsbadensis]
MRALRRRGCWLLFLRSWFGNMHGGLRRFKCTSGRRATVTLVVLLPSVLIGLIVSWGVYVHTRLVYD